MEINITALAATITALGVVLGAVFGIYRWFLKQEKQDRDIKSIKEEQSVLIPFTSPNTRVRTLCFVKHPLVRQQPHRYLIG